MELKKPAPRPLTENEQRHNKAVKWLRYKKQADFSALHLAAGVRPDQFIGWLRGSTDEEATQRINDQVNAIP